MTVIYDPSGIATAGNSQIGIAPAVADINAPTEAELTAGTTFQCATEAFGSTTDASTISRKKLCNKVASQRPGDRTYNVEPLIITLDDPQSVEGNALMDKFGLDDVVYLWHRPAVAHDEPVTSGQRVQVIEAIVSSVDLQNISTEAGEEYNFVVNLAVQDRTQVFGTVAAAV